MFVTGRPSLGRGLMRTSVAVAYLIIFAPVLMIVVTSFFAQQIVSFPPTALTLHWYNNAWEKPEFLRGLVTSLQVALLAACIGVPIGTAAALAIVRSDFPGRSAISSLLLAPLAVPGVVAGSGLYMFYVLAENVLDRDIKATTQGLVAAHVLLTIPWTVRLVVGKPAGPRPRGGGGRRQSRRQSVHGVSPHHAADDAAGHRGGRDVLLHPEL